MFNVCRLVSINIYFAKIEIIQNLLECPHALLQDLFSVRNKEKAGGGMLLLESLVVKGSNHGLSDARKCQGTDE